MADAPDFAPNARARGFRSMPAKIIRRMIAPRTPLKPNLFDIGFKCRAMPDKVVMVVTSAFGAAADPLTVPIYQTVA